MGYPRGELRKLMMNNTDVKKRRGVSQNADRTASKAKRSVKRTRGRKRIQCAAGNRENVCLTTGQGRGNYTSKSIDIGLFAEEDNRAKGN